MSLQEVALMATLLIREQVRENISGLYKVTGGLGYGFPHSGSECSIIFKGIKLFFQ